jgi:hypothetical protein
MSDYSSITSLSTVDEAVKEGKLAKVLLLPPELGGRDIAENVVFMPPKLLNVRQGSTTELLSAIRAGLTEIEVKPSYRGSSFVPDKITITASRHNAEPEFRLVIDVW